MTGLIVTVDNRELPATWIDADPELIERIDAALPLEVDCTRWGDELYGPVPIEYQPAETVTSVEPGTLAYWPAGPAICLFWGPTPASTDDTPVAASPVGPFARLDRIDPLTTLEGSAIMMLERP